ncbi:hypothetical protein [Serinicoccus kebangsaanensis]|uniref:hypothetical protein n=1 Tax=Serinicoccus kebangsaanensis TaxID=2602069 RepID=UPI00124EFDFD|nr:hypothetical protein [Serinicoccus kebangsaanensis]
MAIVRFEGAASLLADATSQPLRHHNLASPDMNSAGGNGPAGLMPVVDPLVLRRIAGADLSDRRFVDGT